jgi:glucan phosphorylase
MFRQSLRDGYQYEQPDYWLNYGNPWEIERVQFSYTVKVRMLGALALGGACWEPVKDEGPKMSNASVAQ